ncbi:MAG: XrtA/PEP-CTERM system-associated ATPase [Pseudomonadota bacterium]
MYDQYYGFRGRPFQLTPDPQFYFESASHRKAMSYLGYGLNQGEGFIVITGEVGAGKSTLVAHLMERVDPDALTVAQVVTSALDGEELIHFVAQSFGLDVKAHDKAGALGAIERFLQDEARAGRRCLLIVDECQNLDLNALEELRMLSNFQLGAHPLLQSLLLGQPEFRRTLAQHPDLDQLRQRIIASHHLEALDADEVEDYILHRLSHVGWDGNPQLGERLLPALFEQTDGIPRRVNQVMNRLLLLGAIEEQDTLSVEMLSAVIEEMASDQNRGSSAKPSPLSIEPESATSEPVEDAGIDSVPATEVAALLAQRDARTAELEAALSELQAAGAPQEHVLELAAEAGVEAVSEPLITGNDADQSEALARIEQRLEEQEQSLRHVLSMLIEWLEDDAPREVA